MTIGVLSTFAEYLKALREVHGKETEDLITENNLPDQRRLELEEDSRMFRTLP